MKTIVITVWTCCLALATMATAADFFVAFDGNDKNSGTQAEPFATLQAGVNRLQADQITGFSG